MWANVTIYNIFKVINGCLGFLLLIFQLLNGALVISFGV